jgi:hypothetical protein
MSQQNLASTQMAATLRPSSSFAPPYLSSSSASDPSPPTAKSTTDPVLRNALRYTLSPREYAALHKYVLSRSEVLRKRAPTVAVVAAAAARSDSGRGSVGIPPFTDAVVAGGVLEGDDYNVKAVRHALRVFVVGVLGLKGWDWVSSKIIRREPRYERIPSSTSSY